MTKKNLTLIEWYVERERKIHCKNPETKAPFVDALRNNPQIILEGIFVNAESDIMRAMIDGASNAEGGAVIINDFEFFSNQVLGAFKTEFLN